MGHLREGCGVRGTGRLVKVSTNTVTRYARLAGRHAEKLHDELVAVSPTTREVQLDEKWAFVGKKEAHCDAGEKTSGDNWDHTAIDPESRLLLVIVPGKRTGKQCRKVLEDVKKRTNGRTDLLITSDEHAPYKTAIKRTYATETLQPDGLRQQTMPKELCYATVNKTREGGRVVSVAKTLVYGTVAFLLLYLWQSIVSHTINTSFVERHNSTDRNQNARKGRKTMRFSKDWDMHNAMTFFVAYSYNFCWPVRTLRTKNDSGGWKQRTPAMAAGLSEHVWSTFEWISYPARPCKST
jgi:IS1 family transposase